MTFIGRHLQRHPGRRHLIGRMQLKHLVTLAMIAVFTLLVSFSTYRSISLRIETERLSMLDQVRRDVALLVRHAEFGLHGDLQLLKEEFGYITNDPRIVHTAIIDEHGIVQVAMDYAWHRQPAARLLDKAKLAFIEQARKTRLLLTSDQETEEHTMLVAMSYMVPEHAHQLRTTQRGVIFMACNLDKVREHAVREALENAALDTLLLTLLLVLLLWMLHTFVTRPLRAIVDYSKAESNDIRVPALKLGHAPHDLLLLGDAISGMRAALHRQLVELREKAELNSLILDNTDDGFITMSAKGIILAVSRPVSAIFGYQSEEMIGANITLLMPSPDREQHDHYMERYERTQVPRTIGRRREVSGRRKDGSVFPLELRVQRIIRNNEVFFVGSVRDITERSRLEQAKNEFVSIVSHELRTPLTAINGSLGLILGTVRSQLTPTLLNLIEIAHRNGLRLLALINDLLDMEKLMAGKMALNSAIHAVTPLVRYSVELIAPFSREHNVQIMFEPGPDALIRVDADRLNQALSNLLSNAIKFSPAGGHVWVSTRLHDGRIRISIRDEGPGIPEAFRARMFEKFAQADAADNRQKGGTGLGLAISRELVERMEGSIGFTTEIGKGTEFFVEFAAITSDTGEAPASLPPPSQ